MALTIDTQPVPQAVTQGETATFTVAVSGEVGTVLYQWYQNGDFMLAQNASTLEIGTVLLDDGNTYYVIVSDDVDTLQSDTVALTVSPASAIPPVIQGPEPVTVTAGDLAEFSAQAYGVGPFRYRWRVAGGAALPGGFGRFYSFNAYLRDNGALFEVLVTDSTGLQTLSEPALLTVTEAAEEQVSTTEIDYPSALPGPLVDPYAFTSKSRVRRNDLSSGPPIFTLQDDGGYETFAATWSFSGAQMQAFRDWFRHTVASGSKLFNIGLAVDGRPGDSCDIRKPHQCFIVAPEYDLQGKRWRVSATLVAIEENILGPCANLTDLFDATCGDLRQVICGLIDIWPPVPPEYFPPSGPDLPQCEPYSCEAIETWLFDFNDGLPNQRFGFSIADEQNTTIEWPFPEEAANYWNWATIGGDYEIVDGYSASSSIRAVNLTTGLATWDTCPGRAITQVASVNDGDPFVVEAPTFGDMSGAFIVTRRFLTLPTDQLAFEIVLGTTHFASSIWTVFASNPVAGLVQRTFKNYYAGVRVSALNGSDDLEVHLFSNGSGGNEDPTSLLIGTLSATDYIDGRLMLVTFDLRPRLGALYEDGAANNFYRVDAFVDYEVTLGGDLQGATPTTFSGTYALGNIGAEGPPDFIDGEARYGEPQTTPPSNNPVQQRNVFLALTGPSSDGWTPALAPADSGITYPVGAGGDVNFWMVFASVDGRLGASNDADIRVPFLRNYSNYVLPPECL